jgi:glutamate-1-semialdehyde 2,1-aminomutase
MTQATETTLRDYGRQLAEEFDRRFPRSKSHYERYGSVLLDGTSHAMRWVSPFMPVVRKASGAAVEDLDGHRILDYWQGHFANVLGHNATPIREALAAALLDGRGLQSGMIHELEAEVADVVCRMTGSETLRFTTSGSLGTYYATVLSRAFTGRDLVLKISGGWHGSQPFGLKGVSPVGKSFEHLESEGLSSKIDDEVVLTRFNDVEDLRERFATLGDRIACMLIEPIMGAGGGAAATLEYMREARRLTEQHGSLLLCDEVITGFRFRPGDLTSLYGVKPDVLILGKVIGGGMPVAAVAGRRDVLALGSRDSKRVKFEGGTYSAHELGLVGAMSMLSYLEEHADEVYGRLARAGDRLRAGVVEVAASCGVPIHVLGKTPDGFPASSLVYMHLAREATEPPSCPDELAERSHPLITERLLKATLLLEDLSTRSGIGAVSTAHTDADLDRTLESVRAGFDRLRKAGLY